MMMANVERPSRPATASRAAPIDVLSREVEEMEMQEQQQLETGDNAPGGRRGGRPEMEMVPVDLHACSLGAEVFALY